MKLNEVLDYMNEYVKDRYMQDSEPMLNYKDLQLVLEHIYNLEKQNLNFYNILKDLEEWLKEEINKLNEVKLETLEELHRVVRLNTIKESLDKITELKEKYK